MTTQIRTGLELPGSYSTSVLVEPLYKNHWQEKGPDIRTRHWHWHWHWLCFSAFFLPWGLAPPNVKKMRKTKPMPMPMPGSYIRSFFLVLIPGFDKYGRRIRSRQFQPGSYLGGRVLNLLKMLLNKMLANQSPRRRL